MDQSLRQSSDGAHAPADNLDEDPLLGLSAPQDDALLDCLEYLTKFYGQPKSKDVLKSGLPLIGEVFTPDLFIRAAERVGLNSRVVPRKISLISKHVLPAVLTLKDRRACILLEIFDGGRARVFFPETGGIVENILLEDLDGDYTGYVIYVRTRYKIEAEKRGADVPKPDSWFWGAIYDNWWTYAQVALAAVLINLFALASPFFIMMVYDRVIPNNAIETLWVLATGVATVVVFDLILKTLRAYFIDSAGKKTDVTVACRIYDQVLDMQMTARPASAGAFANTLREFETLREFFTSASLAAIIDLPFVLVFLLVLYLIAGDLALVLVVAVPLTLIYGILIQFPLNSVVKKNFKELEVKHGVLVETINGLETIKTIGGEARMRGLWENVVGLTARSAQKSRALSQSGVNITGMIQQLTSVVVVLFGVHLISEGEITVGALIGCVMLGGRALAPLGQVAQLLTRFHQSMSSLNALNKIMSSPVERPVDKTFLHRPELLGNIEFKGVKFTYPGRDVPALQELSFQVQAGEHVGVIGRVGSGKSTIAKLLLGVFEPEDGTILMDGTDMRQIDPSDLRRNMGYVAQDPFLFRGTIRDNITAAAPFAEDAAVLEAAKLAGIDEFINQTSVGFDLPVGERGEGLSGGQRQSITIARALLRKPNMLVLDEPTSSMDSRSEHILKQSLKNYLAGKTLVLVTHRASLLSFVDRIIVVEAGRIIADGPRQKILDALTAGKIVAPKEGAKP